MDARRHSTQLRTLIRQLNAAKICKDLDEKDMTKNEAYPSWI